MDKTNPYPKIVTETDCRVAENYINKLHQDIEALQIIREAYEYLIENNPQLKTKQTILNG